MYMYIPKIKMNFSVCTAEKNLQILHGQVQQCGFPTRFDTNRSVQKQARSLKFRINQENGLYYLFIENKDLDQLCSLCFRNYAVCWFS